MTFIESYYDEWRPFPSQIQIHTKKINIRELNITGYWNKVANVTKALNILANAVNEVAVVVKRSWALSQIQQVGKKQFTMEAYKRLRIQPDKDLIEK